jgi:hypothetical protein
MKDKKHIPKDLEDIFINEILSPWINEDIEKWDNINEMQQDFILYELENKYLLHKYSNN